MISWSQTEEWMFQRLVLLLMRLGHSCVLRNIMVAMGTYRRVHWTIHRQSLKLHPRVRWLCDLFILFSLLHGKWFSYTRSSILNISIAPFSVSGLLCHYFLNYKNLFCCNMPISVLTREYNDLICKLNFVRTKRSVFWVVGKRGISIFFLRDSRLEKLWRNSCLTNNNTYSGQLNSLPLINHNELWQPLLIAIIRSSGSISQLVSSSY